ncbi:MAG: TIGR02449 family protein [Gammaproteobacteria bacterium]|nr:TIGR02449 family protein [Gammaproteobacteria bacterium]
MENQSPLSVEQKLAQLQQQLDQLLARCQQQRDENRLLREQAQRLTLERAQLVEKNELARNRVEAMISRLKSMEEQ